MTQGTLFSNQRPQAGRFPWMEGSKVIEVPVVCYLCRRIYRHAKIVPITPAPKHITGTCDDCQRVGSVDYGRRGPTQKYAEHAREKWFGPFPSKRPIPAEAGIANSPPTV